MDRRVLGAILIVLIAVAIAAAIGVNAYQAGVARGLAESGRTPAPGTEAMPYRYYGPYWHGPGFGFFGFLFPLLFIFLIFALFKGLFWGWRGPWRYGPPPSYEEWHRRAHEAEQERGQKA